MSSEKLQNDEICPECGKQVEILNGDLQFSIELHAQSHKSLESINYEIYMQEKINPQPTRKGKLNYVSCPECKEIVIILNNNVTLAIENHMLKHKSSSSHDQCEDQPPTTSKKKRSKKKLKDVQSKTQYLPESLLKDVFDLMPSELKAHQGFIFQSENGKAMCKVCELTIEPIISINEHLKTRFHEDRVIKYYRDALPHEMYNIMEFVSFNNSSLCCNLCRYNFFMCTNDPHRSIYFIMMHNLSKGHLEKKTFTRSDFDCGKGSVIIKSLAQCNQIMNDNLDFLEYKINPEFKCKLCNVVVGSSLNEISLYQSFNVHFISETHLNAKAAYELNAFNMSNTSISGKNTHHFTISKGSIYCSFCECYVEPNVEALTTHIEQVPYREMLNVTSQQQNSLYSALTKINSPITRFSEVYNVLSSLYKKNDTQEEKKGKLDYVYKTNANCVVENNRGITECLVCNRDLPPTADGIKMHLLGKRHLKKVLRKKKKYMTADSL